MKKKTGRLLVTMILSISMIFTMLPMTAVADDEVSNDVYPKL